MVSPYDENIALKLALMRRRSLRFRSTECVFFGVTNGVYSSVPPGPHAGNTDLREMVEGTRMFIPVWTGRRAARSGLPGALFPEVDGTVYGYAQMKTLTELSGTLIRTAAAAIAEARRSLPKEEEPAPPATTEAAPQAAEQQAAEPQAAEAPVADAAGEPTAAADAPAAPAPAAPAPAPKAEREAESEAVKAALDEAVAKATGLSGDRVAMLRAAVEAVGRRAADVRLVRVFGLEEQVRGAQAIGEYQYVVDLFPSSMSQVAGAARGERGRGGRRGGGRGGGGGGGDRGAKGATTGGFSMDSLREDRKSERGGRGHPGGGRRPGGGGSGGRGP